MYSCNGKARFYLDLSPKNVYKNVELCLNNNESIFPKKGEIEMIYCE